MRYGRGVPGNNNGTRPSICIHLPAAASEENMEKYEETEKKRKYARSLEICAVCFECLGGGLGVDGGSNGQKNITFDLSIGGEEELPGRIDSS